MLLLLLLPHGTKLLNLPATAAAAADVALCAVTPHPAIDSTTICMRFWGTDPLWSVYIKRGSHSVGKSSWGGQMLEPAYMSIGVMGSRVMDFIHTC